MKKFCHHFIFLTSLLAAFAIKAHEGPAFPILVDSPLGANKISIWADPDTGAGTFDLFIEGESMNDYEISLIARPSNDQKHVLRTRAESIKKSVSRLHNKAILPFDRELIWNVEFAFKQNTGTENTINLPIEVTPPGPGRKEFALYFLPFLLVAFVWIKVLLAKRKITP